MELDQLRTLLTVVEYGSFTKAAAALGLSQSTVSSHVKLLEIAVGAKLADRDRNRVQLTAQGAIFAAYARNMLTLQRDALASMQSERQGTLGQLHLTASTIPAEYLLPPMLAQLRRTHPGVGISLHTCSSRAALAAVVSRSAEVAIVGQRTKDRRLEFRAVATDQIVLVCAPPSPAPPPPADLSHVALISRAEGSGTRAATQGLLNEYRCHADERLDVEVNSTQAAKQCALHGLGMTLISKLAVEDELASGRLVTIPLPGTPAKRTFYIAWARGSTPSTGAEAFVALWIPDDATAPPGPDGAVHTGSVSQGLDMFSL
ncbi:MAG: LysR substrate-binding domain-containing protein [Nannocystaceae bacterium]